MPQLSRGDRVRYAIVRLAREIVGLLNWALRKRV